jgi:hypothetical protein
MNSIQTDFLAAYKNNCFKKYTIPKLKEIATAHKLHVSGTKPIIILRIYEFYKRDAAAVFIQRYFRGRIARIWTSILLKTTTIAALHRFPVNDVDFYSFEPISTIPRKFIFYVNGAGGETYAFHIQSFLILVTSGGAVILNPYTREPISKETIHDAIHFFCFFRIMYPNIKIFEKDGEDNSFYKLLWTPNLHVSLQRQSTINKLQELRNNTINYRIENLFIDIDLLGNYTSSKWFSNMSTHQCFTFWNLLYDIWLYRAEILQETKNKICPIHSPFLGKKLPINQPMPALEIIQDHCLFAMENMIYMSTEEEYRKLGAMYVLCALTMVSHDAQIALPWLADIIMY